MLEELDRGLARLARSRAGRWRRLDRLMVLAARWGSWAEIALLAALALSGRRGPGAAARTFAALGLAQALVLALGRRVGRPRPFSGEPDWPPLVAHHPGRSFPSRHVASAFAMATVASAAHRPIGRAMALLGGALGLSRVYCGLHYPSDVLAGALLGVCCGRLFAPPAEAGR